jgi:hypothetical protein
MYYFVNSQTMDRCGKKKQSTSVADPGSGAFLTPGSEIRNGFVLDPGFPNSFLGPKKIAPVAGVVPGPDIREPGSEKNLFRIPE